MIDAGIQCDSWTMQKKYLGRRGVKHNSKLSSESPWSILHIASVSLCIITFVHTNSERRARRWPNTEQRAKENRDQVPSSWEELNNDAPIQYCTQVIIQIYTDSGVMYKNGQNLRHYARVFSISRLHLSSKKLADNTKGHLKFFKTISYRGKKYFWFMGPKPGYLWGAKIIYLLLSSL